MQVENSLPAADKVCEALIGNVREHILDKELEPKTKPYITKKLWKQIERSANQSKLVPDKNVDYASNTRSQKNESLMRSRTVMVSKEERKRRQQN